MLSISLKQIAQALGGEVSGDQVLAPGPQHSPQDRSLAIKPDATAAGGFVVHSFAGDDAIAAKDYVREKLGLPEFAAKKKSGNGASRPYSPTIAKYVYRDERGQPSLRVDRTAAKEFYQHHWTGELWASGAPKGPKVPYRLPELIAAAITVPVYVCEGERDCDNLAKLGFVATCNSGGADNGSGGKWTQALNQYFKDRHVCILVDNDHAGRVHAQHVARNLDLIAASVRVVELPGLPPKGDASDWLKNDPTGAQLVRECKAAPLWEPGASTSIAASDDELIAELAALPRLDFAKRRKEAAEQIGVGVTELDKIVAEARGEPPPTTPERWAVEPWEQEVATADLLQALQDTYCKHVVLPEHGAEAMALWCLHAWAVDASYVSPFLMFTSPEMRCGKSTALSLLYRTGPRTTLASNISSASVFRYINACHPVLLIDEADTFARDDEALRGILNSGHTRDTAFVIRCEGDDNTPKEFSTWAPKAIAAIGNLAATLRDRSIILPMRRKKPGERVIKLRAQGSDAFVTLRRKAARWIGDNLKALKGAKPEIPEALSDRSQDNWEPLLAIADLAGGDWPQLARTAALSLSSSAEAEDDTIKVQLLGDIEAVFTNLNNCERLFSKRLIAELVADEVKPWATYHKGKPITERQLARLLSDFKIKPGTMRIEDDRAKGYQRADFEDAFERYLPDRGVLIRDTVTSLNTLDLFAKSSVTPDLPVTDQNSPNSLKILNCHGVTDENPLPGKGEVGRTCAQCNGSDGTEQLKTIAGQTVWLHAECRRFYFEDHKS